MASTVLPNGIIIPEKYSRDWYADLYHNWQELDNLLGGGTPKDGTLTIQKNGSTVRTFSANQATDETVNIEVPTKTSDLTNDSNFVQSSDLATVATSGSYNDLSNKPATMTPTSHTHGNITNDGKIGSNANKPLITTTNGTITTGSFGTTANTFCEGNDSRLSDARTPTVHTHSASDITSGLATVATSGSYNDLSNKPTIPTVNNATLTIQKNGTTVKTFTANASSNVTANITVPTKTSDLTNDSGFITSDDTKIPLAGSNAISGDLIPSTNGTVNLGSPSYQWNQAYIKSLTINGVACGDILTHNASEFVPRSGGAVMTGGTLARTVNTGTLAICAGTDSNSGGNILLYGSEYGATGNNYRGAIGLYVLTSYSAYKSMFLFTDGTWTWTGQAVQLISDQRLKQQIAEIDDKLLDAWEDVDLVQFKYNDAVDTKGTNARLHTGYVVQQIDSACKSHGVDISEYGLYCHEEYPEETKEVEVEQADGTKVKETKVIREASEHYSLRYTEVYAVECMYLRRCIKQLTARIEELEKGNNTK